MTDDKVLQAARETITKIHKSFGVTPQAKRHDPDEIVFYDGVMPIKVTAHLSYCLEQIEIFLKEGRREKAMRWLGFMQGCAFLGGAGTINELGRMNMPSGETELRGSK